MAEQFTDALLSHVEGANPGRTAKAEMRRQRERFAEDGEAETAATESTAADAEEETADKTSGGGFGDAFSAFEDDGVAMNGGSETSNEATASGTSANGTTPEGEKSDADRAMEAALAAVAEEEAESVETGTQNDGATTNDPEAVQSLRADIEAMEPKTRRMLAYYLEQGPDKPLNAHFSAGGSGDRTAAYARNRQLRLRGLVEHVGRGKYDTRVAALLDEECDDSLDDVGTYASKIERDVVDGA
jgi:hypothetical protein